MRLGDFTCGRLKLAAHLLPQCAAFLSSIATTQFYLARRDERYLVRERLPYRSPSINQCLFYRGEVG